MWTALEKEQLVGGHLRVRRWKKREVEDLKAACSVHRAVELSWVSRGSVRYEIGRSTYEVHAGQAMVVPAGVEHSTTLAGQTHAGSLWLDAAAFVELADAAGADPLLTPGPIADPTGFISLAQLLSAEAFEGGPGALMAADALSQALALKLVRLKPGEQRCGRSTAIRRAVQEIETRYAETLDVDALARSAAMSRYHFSRRFQAEVGKSPYAYLQHWRLQRAAELLKGGRAAVTEAAYSCGFTDLGRFGRKFRETYGCTPRDYAQRS